MLVKSEPKANEQECCSPDKKSVNAPKGSKGAEDASESCRPPDNADVKKRIIEDENEPKTEIKRKSGFEGAFIGRRKVSQVPHLSSSPGDGGSESSGTASPSPTKSTTSPRRKKSDSSCQDYAL